MEWIRNRKFSRTIIAVLLLTMTAWLIPAGLMAEKAEAAVQLDDPIIRDTSQMEARQKVTWDCVWFGSYPQSEVVCETDTERIGELTGGAYDNQYVTVSSAQWDKITGAKYNNYGDATVDGVKYKCLSKTDVVSSWFVGDSYYKWGDDTVRYFRYEPIKWRVLNVNGTDAFLLADKGIDGQRYNTATASVDVTWETCTMRSWLNGYGSSSNSYGRDYTKLNFINTAFTSSERSAIKTTEVVNDDNIDNGTEGGNDTSDKIFLLSENEVYNSSAALSYGFVKSRSTDDEARRSKSSTFAKAMGVWSNTYSPDAGNCRWWLRSPGSDTSTAVYVCETGYPDKYGNLGGVVYYDDNAVRPALHLSLSSSDLYSYAGTVSSDGSMNEEGGSVVTPDEPGSAQIDIDAQAEGDGTVLGGGAYTSGDSVVLKAVASDTSVFTGWYEDGKLISKESEYGFLAEKDRIIVGKFKTVKGDVFGSESMIRIAGSNRYATSTAAADTLKKSLAADKFENIIVASGDDYPDALAGSYLAKVKNAPVMLVGKDANTEADVKQYINKNLKKGGTVYLLGGTGVVTSRFEAGVKKLKDSDGNAVKVERLGGQTRYETNIAILKAAGVDKEDLLVCTGEGFADSLSASAVGKPILLVAVSGVDDTQKKYLGSLKIKDIYLIGGTGVVSEKIGTQLKKYDKDDKCERVAGQNRYLTSVAVAKEFFPKGSDSAVLAYAMNFPDGLAGGPLALSMKAPLILTDNSGYSDAVAYAKNAGIEKAAALGGPALISDGVVKAIIN